MLFGRRKTPLPPPATPSVAERDEAAYTLLEEARIRCEDMQAEAEQPPEQEWLLRLHRELGTAGYLASENISCARRTALVALARTQATVPTPDARGPLAALIAVAEQAAAAVDQALIAPGLSDHALSARSHLAAAAEMLDERRRQRPRPGVGAEIG